jgi:hypothetical protein
MNRRKLQVFVSSTFTDLKEERQAAVEAILKAGHIPAGMELFTAGSKSQLDVIKQWIKESDVYVLLLGARYGSIEPTSGLSYTEVEFDYARELDLPFFAVVLSDAGRAAKVKAVGEGVLERANVAKYDAFRARVCSQMCSFFDTTKDIKLAILETLPQIAADPKLVGWIPASEVGPSNQLAEELTKALEENRRLQAEIVKLTKTLDETKATDMDVRKVVELLDGELIELPINVSSPEVQRATLLALAIAFAGKLADGVSNQMGISDEQSFLRFGVAPKLASFGLAEHAKVPSSVRWTSLKLSKEGVRVLNWARQNYNWQAKTTAANAPKEGKPTPDKEAKAAPAKASDTKKSRTK